MPEALHAQDILPLEVWEVVFQHVELSAHSTPAIARVCRPFNQLGIAQYLLRAGVSSKALAEGDINIASQHLPILQISCCLSLKRLSCDVWLHRDFTALQKTIANFPHLRQISLAFLENVLAREPTTDGARPLRSATRQSRLRALCDIIQTISSRIGERGVLLNQEMLFRFLPDDIPQWQLYQKDRPPLAKARNLLRRSPEMPVYAVVRDSLGRPTKITLPSSLHSLSITEFPSATGSQPSSPLLILNPQFADALRLGPSGTSLALHSLTSLELTPILPHLVMPALTYLFVETKTVDPASLGKFIQHHSDLRWFLYGPPTADKHMRPPPIPILGSYPISLPLLLSIAVTDPLQLISILDTLGHSPCLYEFGFHFHQDTATSTSNLTSALRRIALHPRHTKLVLRLGTTSKRALADDERAVAQSLHRVVRIDVECSSVSEARALLPWLDLLPALERVEFRSARGIFRWSARRRDPHGETVRFLEDAMAALPRVAEVFVRENPISAV
ncbi:hypothetical protein C8R43DRAFT_251450 [Mycena crocata]|nr:hypothetical protein C8R43DRAFT_251450 [Mycena crocata]